MARDYGAVKEADAVQPNLIGVGILVERVK